MQKFAYAEEDLVLVVRANTGSTVTIEHTLPDKTVVGTDVTMAEDGTTGNFYHTFNQAEIGTHLMKTKSVDDTDVDGLMLSIVNFDTSNADIAGAVEAVNTAVAGVNTAVAQVQSVADALTVAVAALDTNQDVMDGKLDTISTKVSGIEGAVENTVGWV